MYGEPQNCVLVIIGVTPAGVKELVGLEIGFRESKASWLLLMNQLKENGLKTSPKLAICNGSLSKTPRLAISDPIWLKLIANENLFRLTLIENEKKLALINCE